MIKQRKIFNLNDIGKKNALLILDRALHFEETNYSTSTFAGDTVGLCFFQPSTRTRIGFAAAATRLGCSNLFISETKYTPEMLAPESIEDTIRVISGYCNLLVIRHDNSHLVAHLTNRTKIPVINGGSGREYHPTQALIDLYAIRQHKSRLNNLRIGIAGDIMTSRVAHSLLRALAWFKPAEIRLMHPRKRNPLPEVINQIPKEVISHRNELVLENLDVLYVANTPVSSSKNNLPYDLRNKFILTPKQVDNLPQSAIVLCALPRTGDIHPSVDSDNRAVYFTQSDSGLFVRMATIEFLLSK